MTEQTDNLDGISVAAIVHAGDFCEEKIGRAFASLAAGVDEFVLVHTGAADGSGHPRPDLTDGMTLPVPAWLSKCCGDVPVTIFCRAWDWDFSAARNYGLDRCRYSWAFVIDADEVLYPEDGTTALMLRELVKLNDGAAVYFFQEIMFKGDAPVSTVSAMRLFTHAPKHRYHGFIHNQLAFEGLAGNTDIQIHHYGGDGADHAARTRRNEMFRKRLFKHVEEHPDDLENHYNLCKTLSYDMNHEGTIVYGERLIEKLRPKDAFNPTPEEAKRIQQYHRICYMVGFAQTLFGRHREAFDSCALGLRFVESADLCFVAGNAAYMLGDFPNAYMFFRRYLMRLPVERSGSEHAVVATETFAEFVRDKHAVLIRVMRSVGVEPFRSRESEPVTMRVVK